MSEHDHDQKLSGLFAGMVMQYANMATVFLGLAPHPEDGETRKDLGMAKLMIDHLEMLEVKTKGNLQKQEQGILRQSLVSLRMAFIEAARGGAETAAAAAPPAPPKLEETANPAPPAAGEEEPSSKKRFTKTYE